MGLTKFLQSAGSEQIVEAISSVFASNDILVYLITTRGNLMFISISATNTKIVTVEPLFLGEFETLN